MIPPLPFPVTGVDILFVVVAIVAVGSGLGVVINRNPVRSALFLVVNLFCAAILYLLLDSYFLAAVQILVYAGAIMVLFLFVIMLLNLGAAAGMEDRGTPQRPVAFLLALAFFGLLFAGVFRETMVPKPPAEQFVTQVPRAEGIVPVLIGDPQAIGHHLFREYVFPFQIVAVLLLIAVIGAVVMSKRRLGPDAAEEERVGGGGR